MIEPTPRWLLAGLAWLPMAGCSDMPSEPGERTSISDTVVLAFSGDSAGFRAIGTRSGQTVGRALLDPENRLAIGGTAVDRDGGRLYGSLTVVGPDAFGELFAVELPSLDVAWRKRLDELETQLSREIEMRGGSPVSTSSGGGRLYLLARRGSRNPPGEFGIVTVDVNGPEALGYLGGFAGNNRKIASVRGENGRPQLLVVGGPRSAAAVRLMIYRDEGGLPVLRDSVFLFEPPPLDDDLSVRLGKVFSGRDGRHVYVRSSDSLFKVDARKKRIVGRAPRARRVPSVVAVLRDPVRLVFTDFGFFESPGSGELQIYDGDLVNLGTLDIGRGAMRGIAVGPRGDRVFVTSGTPERFGGFVREASVVVVDVRNDTVLRVLDVGGFGVGDVHVF